MVRTQIFLSADDLASLARMARMTGKTRSSLIREALAHFQRGGRKQESTLEALQASAGSWKRKQTGEQFVERIRKGRLARLHT